MFNEFQKDVARRLPIAPLEIAGTSRQDPISRPDPFFYDHQILYITDGSGEFTLGGQIHHLTKGQGAFMRAGSTYSYRADRGCTLATRWVAFCGGEGILSHYGIQEYLTFDVPAYLPEATDQLEVLCRQSTRPMNAAHMLSWLVGLLDTLFEPMRPIAERVDRYLASHLSQPFSLSALAKALDIDRFRLCRMYREQRATTIVKTLKDLRMHMAKRLLREGARTVGDIASACGYESVSYFIKHFRESCSMTPTAYRRALLKER